jgi:hypothetical protein
MRKYFPLILHVYLGLNIKNTHFEIEDLQRLGFHP